MSEYKKDELVPSTIQLEMLSAKAKTGNKSRYPTPILKVHMMEPKNVIGILLFNIFFLH